MSDTSWQTAKTRSCDRCKGYIEVSEYPRACKATTPISATGEVETVEAGKTEDALKYEVEAMEAAIEGTWRMIARSLQKIRCEF